MPTRMWRRVRSWGRSVDEVAQSGPIRRAQVSFGAMWASESAFMVGLAFAVAASCNFPVLLMSTLWKGTTTRGALIGGFLGMISAVVMVVLSKAVWVQTFGNPKELFPYDNPALFSMTIAFLGIWIFSKMDASQRARQEQAAFDEQYIRSETGIGAGGAHVH